MELGEGVYEEEMYEDDYEGAYDDAGETEEIEFQETDDFEE